MAKSFKLHIFTPEKIIYEGDIVSLVVPGDMGYVGVLANHAPFISNIVPGKIRFTRGGSENTLMYSKGKGFLEVYNNDATLLLDEVDIGGQKSAV